MFDFIFFSPPPASVPITLSVLGFGKLRATIRGSVYGVGHTAHNAEHQLHGDPGMSPLQGHHGGRRVCPPRGDTGAVPMGL